MLVQPVDDADVAVDVEDSVGGIGNTGCGCGVAVKGIFAVAVGSCYCNSRGVADEDARVDSQDNYKEADFGVAGAGGDSLAVSQRETVVAAGWGGLLDLGEFVFGSFFFLNNFY